eukprot:g7693.t1
MLFIVSPVAAQTVEVGEVVGVTVSANAFDPDNGDEKGCPPDGCLPANTRDGDLEGISRWSCKRDLVEDGDECHIVYEFSGALDIYSMWVAFYDGDTRTRTLDVVANGVSLFDVTSGGDSENLEEFVLNAEGVLALTLVSVGLEADDWLSVIEVEFYVSEGDAADSSPAPAVSTSSGGECDKTRRLAMRYELSMGSRQ